MTISGVQIPRAICILGMHRSGTSAITRAVNLLGAFLGEDADLMAPAPDNPEGFWERNDIVALHDRILATFNLSWDTALPLPQGWETSQEIALHREEIKALVTTHLAPHPLWAWKDPRTCLLLPLWKRHLTEQGTALSTIFVSRNPRDVAHSLAKRNGFSLDRAYGIWFNYTLAALLAVSDTPTIFLSYDRLLDEAESELRNCALDLSLPWPEEGPAAEELRSLLKPSLRHSLSATKDLDDAPRPVQELYDLMLDLVGQRNVPGIPSDSIRPFAASFHAYSSFIRYDVEHVTAEVRRSALSAQKEIETVRGQLEERTEWALQLDQELTQRSEQLSKLRIEFQERSAWAVKLREENDARGEILARLRAEFDERTAWALKLQEEGEQRKQSIAQLETDLAKLRSEFEERTAWALNLREEGEKRKERIAELESYLVRVRSEFEERTAWALNLREEGEKRKERIAELERDLARVRSEYEEVTGWALNLREEDEKRKERLADLEGELSKVLAELQERTDWALTLQEEVERRGERIAELQKELTERTDWALELRGEAHTRGARVADLQNELEERTHWALQLKKDVARASEQIDILSEKLETATALREELVREAQEKERSLHAACNAAIAEKERLAVELERRDGTLHEFLNSRSWRVTAPLRFMYALLKK